MKSHSPEHDLRPFFIHLDCIKNGCYMSSRSIPLSVRQLVFVNGMSHSSYYHLHTKLLSTSSLFFTHCEVPDPLTSPKVDEGLFIHHQVVHLFRLLCTVSLHCRPRLRVNT